MKAISKIFTLALLSIVMLSCEDDLATKIDGVAIEDTDLIQVEDSNPNVTVYVTAQSSDLSSIKVSVSPEDTPEEVYSATLNKITADKLNRVKVDVPFPTPDIAPTGMYTVTIYLNESESKSVSYLVKIINNRTIKYCNFPTAPSGKVGIFVSVPGGAAITEAGKSIYIVGDFMDENGAAGDWNPGNPDFKLTKLSDQCYYIFLNTFPTGANFKLTLGSWDEEFLDQSGNGMPNQVHKGGNAANITAYNFKTMSVTQYIIPEVLPSAAIVSGKNTLVINVGKVSDDAKYYLVAKNATNLTDAIQMYRVAGTTKLAAAMPKDNEGTEYKIVKNDITNEAIVVNPFGYKKAFSFTIANSDSPYYEATSAQDFKNDFTGTGITYGSLLLVGGASPAGWNNSDSNTQFFTKTSDTKFTLTINLADNGSGGFLIIHQVGNWDAKIGKDSGTALLGTMKPGGGDFSPPSTPGTYKIDLDLETASYTLTLQN